MFKLRLISHYRCYYSVYFSYLFSLQSNLLHTENLNSILNNVSNQITLVSALNIHLRSHSRGNSWPLARFSWGSVWDGRSAKQMYSKHFITDFTVMSHSVWFDKLLIFYRSSNVCQTGKRPFGLREIARVTWSLSEKDFTNSVNLFKNNAYFGK